MAAAKALSLRPQRGHDGKDDGEHPPLAADLVAEVGAARADPNVTAQKVTPQHAGELAVGPARLIAHVVSLSFR